MMKKDRNYACADVQKIATIECQYVALCSNVPFNQKRYGIVNIKLCFKDQ